MPCQMTGLFFGKRAQDKGFLLMDRKEAQDMAIAAVSKNIQAFNILKGNRPSDFPVSGQGCAGWGQTAKLKGNER